MQDAVVLANCLYEMNGLSPDDIKETLSAFKEERYSRVKDQCEASRMNAKLLYGQVRYLSFPHKHEMLPFFFFLGI